MYFRPLLLLLFALSFVPYLLAGPSTICDKRVESVLHSMPVETEKICVANARNILFDQPVIQLPDAEACLQLNLMQCFRRVTSQIHQDDVLLCVRCCLPFRQSEEFDTPESRSAHFLFLTSDEERDRELSAELEEGSKWTLSEYGRKVYEFSEDGFLCLPKPGLLIYTRSDSLMRTILSRLDAWWLPTLALPAKLHEWSYTAQQAPYWGLEHFDLQSDCESQSAQGPQITPSVGSTFDYMGKDFDLHLTHISTLMETGYPGRKPITEFVPLTHERLVMAFPEKFVSRITISNVRGIEGHAFSILENFSSRPTWRQ